MFLPSQGKWIEKNRAINVSLNIISRGMIYVGEHLTTPSGEVDPCLISSLNENKEIEAKKRKKIDNFPSFFTMTITRKKDFLDWLASDRSNPNIDIGYVLVYLYGLERWSVTDSQEDTVFKRDSQDVLDEIVRLIGVYGSRNGTFAAAAIRLWTFIAFKRISQKEVFGSEPKFYRTGEFPIYLEYKIGILASDKMPLKKDLAYEWVRLDPLFSKHWNKMDLHRNFEKQFKSNFQIKFDNGIKLKSGKGKIELKYTPSSVEWREFQGINVKLKQTKINIKTDNILASLDGIIELTISQLDSLQLEIVQKNTPFINIKKSVNAPSNTLIILDCTIFTNVTSYNGFIKDNKSESIKSILQFLLKIDSINPSKYGVCFFELEDNTHYYSYIKDLTHSLAEIFRTFGWRVVFSKNRDISNLIATLAAMAAGEGLSIDIFTAQEIMLQMVNNNINVVNPISGQRHDSTSIFKDVEILPSQLKELWSIMGNSRLKVAGIKGINRRSVVNILNKYDSLNDILENISAISTPIAKLILINKDYIEDNLAKVSLLTNVDLSSLLDKEGIQSLTIKPDLYKLSKFYIDNGLYGATFKLTHEFLNKWITYQFPIPPRYKNQKICVESNFAVYRIRNLITKRVYFGSTLNLRGRWQTHIRELERDIHLNSRISNDFKVYGLNSFEFRVLSRHKNRDEMLIREQLLISMFYGRNCYNIMKYVEMNNGAPLGISLTVHNTNCVDLHKNYDSSIHDITERGYGQFTSIHAMSKAIRIPKQILLNELRVKKKIVIENWAISLFFVLNPNKIDSSQKWQPTQLKAGKSH